MCQGAGVEAGRQLCKTEFLLLPLMWVLVIKHSVSGFHPTVASLSTGEPSNPLHEGF